MNNFSWRSGFANSLKACLTALGINRSILTIKIHKKAAISLKATAKIFLEKFSVLIANVSFAYFSKSFCGKKIAKST